MKVLFISPFLDSTGYSQAGIDYCLAMDSVGIDVVCRPLKLNLNMGEIPRRLGELIEKDDKNCDIVIQHALPHMMEYNGNFQKNIALFASETDTIKPTTWPLKLNQMDEVWVINHYMKEACINSNVKSPIKVIPHTVNVNKFQNNYEKFDIPDIYGTFSFYFIGEVNRRKNLAALVKAFHIEFDVLEPVSLVLKVNGGEPNQTGEEVKKFINEIVKGLKIHRRVEDYKPAVVITNYLSNNDLYRLHATCDCYVSSSYGEACNLSALDALGFGKTPIVTGGTGMDLFINDSNGWVVPSHPQPCFGMNDTLFDLYSARENWREIDIRALGRAMREAYENQSLRTKRSEAGKKGIGQYGYDKIGNLIKETLCQ